MVLPWVLLTFHGSDVKAFAEDEYRFHYDNQGRLSGWTDGNGHTVKYEFDKEGRLVSVRSPEDSVTLAYDANDNILQVEDETGNVTYRYDAFDRLVEVTYKYSPEKRVLYEYDPLGRIASIKVVGTTGTEYEVRYEYDILGNLLAVDDGEGRIEYTYQPKQRQVIRRLPNGITTTFTYSPLGELLAIRHMGTSGQLIAAYEYEHDAAGNVTCVREETAEGVKVIRYEWDKRGYLTALHLPDSSTERYEYDAMGNRIAKITPTGTIRYEYDKYGRLAKAGNDTYKYDRAGNLIEATENGKHIQFKWDSQGRLKEIRLPTGTVRYGYDWVGNLISRTQDGETKFFLPNPLAPVGFTLAEFDHTGKLTWSYLYGDALLGCRDVSGQKRYFLEDGFSSIRHITDPSGQVVGSRDYSPFAEIIHQSGELASGFRMAGEWQDPVARYWFIGGRIYDSRRGRYITPYLGVAFQTRADRFNAYAHACNASYGFTSPRCHQTHENGRWQGERLNLSDRLNEKKVHFDNALGLGMGEGSSKIPDIVQKWGGHIQLIIISSTDNSLLDAVSYLKNDVSGASLGDLKWVAVDTLYRHSGFGTTGFQGTKQTINMDVAFGESDTRGVGRVSDLTSWHIRPIDKGVGVAFTPEGLVRFLRGLTGFLKSIVTGKPPFKKHALPYQFPLVGGVPPKKYDEVWVYDMNNDEWHYYRRKGDSWELVEVRKEMPLGDFRREKKENTRVTYLPKGPDWPDDHGGGGGGPSNPFGPGGSLHDPMKIVQEDIGGIELSATGKFLGQLGHITGLVYDKDRDRLVLVGDGDISLPPMDLSYFAVAEQLVSQGYDTVWFTLDPADPRNPRGKWMRCIWGPPGLPADLLSGTPPGNVMFEADWLLKQYSFGVEVGENGRVVPRTCHVPGFKDMFTLGFEHFSGSRREIWNRFWIVIGDVIFRRSGNAVVIDDVNVRVMTERMYVTSRGLQSSGGVVDPRAEAFAKFFEDHYDEFAQESPQFAQLKEWGKVFALVKWLHNNGIPIGVDPEWVQPGKYVAKVTALSGQQEREKTYRRGNAIVTETRIVQLFGGDEVVAKPVEIKDDGRATRFADALHNALKRQPSRSDFPVEVDGKRLTGVLLPLTTSGKQLWEKAKSQDTVQQHGLTYHLGPDRKVQYAEDASGMRIDYHRDSKGNLVGFKARSADGWTATATHYSGTVIDVTSPRGDRYTYRWNQEGYLTDVLVNGQSFLHCAYDPSQRMAKISYSGYTQTLTFDGADRLQTWTVESTNGEVGGTRGTLTLNYNEKGQVTHVQTNTGNYLEVTYENGQVRTVRTAGNEVEYSWRDNDRLVSLRSGDVSVNYGYEGKELKTINIQRGDAVASAIFENGLLSEVQNFSGGRWSYHYDQQGALVGVSDPTGAEAHYSYDADGHLTEVRLPDGRRLQYVYGQFSGKARQEKATNLVRLLAVNFLPENREPLIGGQASGWQTFP